VVASADAVVTICRGLLEDLAARGVARDRLSIMHPMASILPCSARRSRMIRRWPRRWGLATGQ
jgi:hypothetical protein